MIAENLQILSVQQMPDAAKQPTIQFSCFPSKETLNDVYFQRSNHFKQCLHKLCNTVCNDTEQKRGLWNVLKPMFSKSETGVTNAMLINNNKSTMRGEIIVVFWAFAKTPQVRHKLLDFLRRLLLPRIFVASETKTKFFEALFVFKNEPLGITKEHFEEWFSDFLENLHVSAGSMIIDVYLGKMMVTCLDRIERGDPASLNHNLNFNNDFLTLYRIKQQITYDTASVEIHTNGLIFEPSAMVTLFHENNSLLSSLRDLNNRERILNRTIIQVRENTTEALRMIQVLRDNPNIRESTRSILGSVVGTLYTPVLPGEETQIWQHSTHLSRQEIPYLDNPRIPPQRVLHPRTIIGHSNTTSAQTPLIVTTVHGTNQPTSLGRMFQNFGFGRVDANRQSEQ